MIVVSHISALHLCSRLAQRSTKLARPCAIGSLRDCASAERDLAHIDFSPFPLDVDCELELLVGADANRFATKGTRRHVWKGPLPSGSLYRLSEDICVTSPKFSLLLLSKGTPFNKLIALCSEACSCYDFDDSPRGFFDRPSLTSIKKVHRFLDKMGPASGTAKLRRALRYAVEDSRSPIETALGILMNMPPRLGGYGLPKPVLNHRVVLSGEVARMAGRSYVELDLFFPERAVAVEYDSSEFHTGANRIANDARRNNALRYAGVTVINVTWRQVANAQVLEDAMRQVAKALHVRLREPSPTGRANRAQLRADLLPAVRDRG